VAVPDGIPLDDLAREVAALLGQGAAAPAEPLMTAKEVAQRFNVDRGWVYAHARELGAIRLGGGSRAPLRFDPAVVAQQLLPPATPRWTASRAAIPATNSPLLPIKRSRRRLAKGG
jgi:hypothetical protein